MPANDTVAPMTPPVTVAPVAPVAMPTAMVSPQPMAPVAMPAGDNVAPMTPPVTVAPTAPVAMSAPAPAAQPAATGALDFGQFMQHISGKMQQVDGNGVAIINIEILQQTVAAINTQLGTQFAAITDINGNQAAIDAAVAVLTQCGRW
jgi:hypothetical protein